MKITFNLQYHTKWGEQIAVLGSADELGQNQPSKAYRLQYVNDGYWEQTVELSNPQANIDYTYILLNESAEIIREEWGERRILSLPKTKHKPIYLKDAWRTKRHPDNPLYSTAFLAVIFKPGTFKANKVKAVTTDTHVTFQINMPRLGDQQQIGISGNIPALGNWNLSKPLLLGNAQHPLWAGTIALPRFTKNVEYKYGIYNALSKKVEYLEDGPNRSFELPTFEKGNSILITDEYFQHPKKRWKGGGVAIPIFSLRSEKSFGVGEFNDLRLLADWSKKMGLQLIQILPINDTTATFSWVDSYPYAAISVFALHPLYLNMESLEGFQQAVPIKEYAQEKSRLNALPEVDYETVLQLKLKYARQIFDQQKTTFLKDNSFKKFLKKNQHWLKPYALFCYFRDTYQTVNFNEWKMGSQFSEAILTKFTHPKVAHFDQIAFYYFLQFYLDKQLKVAADYARTQQIVLKGDIPIGIYRFSVDAWIAPELYNMNSQAGAPPDPFSETGQNWGFPTYNWEVMAKNGYQWWQNRLQQLSSYFDAFRIDHILGFFRIWEIPSEQVEGSLGFFNKAISIRIEEFFEIYIPFDYDRFCLPYIPEHLVYQLFKTDTTFVLNTFLEIKSPKFYQFLPQFDTQKKIETWFKQEASPDKMSLKKLLFDLIGNVLFFEVAGSNKTAFHPRIDFLKTASFQALDLSTQHKLIQLYNNYFYHRQEDFWRQEAMVKLPALRKATNMLICGEDLGMVPACVPEVMQEMQILTLEIQRMSKNPQTEFLQPKDIPYWSVCSTSTHDMSPLRLWWEECEVVQKIRFYQQELKQTGMPPEKLTPALARLIVQQHLNFPSMWTVLPIQDIVAIDETFHATSPMEERINVPANPQHYWRYRIPFTLEALLAKEDFTLAFKEMINATGRG
jgi:4-alpha-glucanotransferase